LISFKYSLLTVLLLSVSVSFSKGKPVKSENGMVVSASSLASYAGVNILEKGGNAIDAAVATGFMLAVTYPSAGNIGGGGFMVIHLQNETETTIDFREKAPSEAHRDMFLDNEGNYIEKLSREGYTSSGVPGSVAGLIYALEKYGTMGLAEVLEPAIQIAKNGFRIGYEMAESINYYHDKFLDYPSSAEIFTIDGEKLPDNYRLVQNELAETLERILVNGLDGFYRGETADLLVKHSEQLGGILTHQDLETYEVVEREPVKGTYKGYDVISMGPPSSGGICLIETLNALEHFSFSEKQWGSSSYIHVLVEILKQVYADRNLHIGDSDFYNVPLQNLISKKRGEEIKNLVCLDSAYVFSDGAPTTYHESTETTHYSVVDSKRNAVSVTTTINSPFGNKIVVKGAGFLMNNEMDDFSSKPGSPNLYGLVGSEANSIQPGKRMLSSMTPTIVLKDKKPVLVLGSPGGSTIITSVLQVLINTLDFEMNIWEAIDAPRFHHQHLPDKIDYEKFGLSEDVRASLEARGQIMGIEDDLGRVEAIFIDENGIKWGATDPRGYGKAVGY